MIIYKLIHNTVEYKTIELEGTKLLDVMIDDAFNTKNLPVENLGEYRWSKESEGLPSCDFPFLAGNIPIISERAYSVLEEKLKESNINTLPLIVNNLTFYLLNFREAFSGAINLKNSKIQYFQNKEIMNISKYVFNEKAISANSIFMIKELKTFVFVSKEVKRIIESHNLTGLIFEKCDITN